MIKGHSETICDTPPHQWLISNGGDKSGKGIEVTQLGSAYERGSEDF